MLYYGVLSLIHWDADFFFFLGIVDIMSANSAWQMVNCTNELSVKMKMLTLIWI